MRTPALIRAQKKYYAGNKKTINARDYARKKKILALGYAAEKNCFPSRKTKKNKKPIVE